MRCCDSIRPEAVIGQAEKQSFNGELNGARRQTATGREK